MELDKSLRSIVNADSETPELLLKSWLDRLYYEAPRQGLSSLQLTSLVRFICESQVLSISTKFYIVENCLIPNDYLNFQVVEEVVKHLGTANVLSAYKLQLPRNLQAALCKWLVHVFFMILPMDKSFKYSSIWMYLWQYNFLQKWLTYIIVWTTSSVRDVRPWKINLLERIAGKPGYTDSQACATLILKRFGSLVGPSKSITSAISRINCNARKLRTLQELKLDGIFSGKLKRALTNNLNFTEEMVDELIFSQLNQLNFESQSNIISKYNAKVPKGKVSILEVRSLNQLAWDWGILVASKDVEQLVNNPFSWYFLFQLAKNDPVWKLLEDWIIIQLMKVFKNPTKDFHIAKKIIKLCQIQPSFATKIFDEFLAYDYLCQNLILFLYLHRNLVPLVISEPTEVKRFHKTVLQLLTFCHLDKSSRIHENTVPQLCSTVLLVISSWFDEDIERLIPLGLKFVHDFRILLTANLDYGIENRSITTALILTLKILPNNGNQEDSQLKRIMFPIGLFNKLLIYDDPLLLDACCEYLITTKKFLTNKDGSSKYIQAQNLHIMDLTNYLWRNKVLTSKKFFDVPSEFVNGILNNLYLPHVKDRTKFPFSVAGIPALSFVFSVKLAELEKDSHSKTHFLHLINEEGFRKFTKEVENTREQWIPSLRNADDLKIAILKYISNSGPFQHIPLFLFTFLKSLSHYLND